MKNRIEEIRKEKGINQEELAKMMGVSRQTISSLENGRYNPSILLAYKISKYFENTRECNPNDYNDLSLCMRKLKEFHSLCNAYHGIEEGVVYAARSLSEDQMKELEDSFKVRGRNVELTQKLDESLISGFRQNFGAG